MAEETRKKMTLVAAARQFYRYPGPWIMTVALVAAWVARGWVGDPLTLWDGVLALAIVALWPLQEWLIHVFLLHHRPVRLGRWTLDFHNARKHREHHKAPERIEGSFIPLRSVLFATVALPVIWWAVMPTLGLAMTGLGVYLSAALAYEWTHYLVHTPYRPRSRFYRRLWENHRLHHYRNGDHWFGVSRLAADGLLGTGGDPRAVPYSPNCKDILHEAGDDGPRTQIPAC